MCQMIRLCAAWFFVGIVIIPTTVFADTDPRPGSQTALNSLVQSYRRTIIELVEFQEKNQGISGFDPFTSYEEQILATIVLGLDNIDNNAANQLVFDLSGVYFGEAPAAVFSCLVQRKGRKLMKYLKKGQSLTSWCIKELPAKVCHEEKHALSNLLGDIERESYLECDLPIYAYQ
ncbi:Rossmann-fold NAD(P)-binding domain-containing protein [Verminephrobacter aporrectodeae]|uniref:hypothetical protein n=1 Tax=Verminephrobacter aporrectodeae TaxID=1110389 RepID=UPI002244A9D3|nr:hypothetical protein [Verminephrobacter aporrectodeae]